MSQTTIVLAEDHHIVRAGLRALLTAEADLCIVGEAADGIDTVRLVERLQPHIVILDLMMPALNGIEVTRQLHRRVPQSRVIILSMHANEAYVLESLSHGAAGYVLKDATVVELVQAIREVRAGRRYLSAPFSDRAIDAYLHKAQSIPSDRYVLLTAREREVCQLAAEGHSNAAMAQRLFISPRTVEVHRANMMRKLGLRTQSELLRYVLARGLLHPEPDPTTDLPDD
jgi:two-component system, NarL family, response regulator NreC